ncbi:radial spoke head protein 9 homolog isoform X1 [Eublepharis macularius]|uniref:Radial spoke head protein 9 homolog n=1 Tax=Eublepharis macularius TaxID=481883 RepID=A0AA97JV87_EUBMA|nr:radial spoke head protein 9 homolog isoform X1 [Eublepharis macularius]
MDAESLPYALDLVAGSGVCLSPEKRTALRTSLLLVQRDYRFEQVRLWGRIQGIRGAYYIAEGLGPDRAGARSRLYSLNCVDWSLLPPPTEEMIAMTGGIKGRFQGDPSYEYENYDKKEEGEKPYEEETGVLVKEEIRLVTTVDQIDKAVGIVPRGAYIKTPLGLVHENRTFEGLSLTEAKKLSSYFHFTEPVNLKNKTLLEKADLDPCIDFLDSLEHDIPKGSWSIQVERGGRIVVLRSLLWPGLTFYHVPNTKQHGYIYFGSGEKNIDLPFML